MGEKESTGGTKMKHIIQFSGGLASAYVAYMISEEFGKTNCILLKFK